ncbi:hypothetical protein PR048_016451 [Dryococelus australis]|uniref:Uncharacterized protein n=1 Tax=Dryococelus australis TaxID=614101 RepID=A0ABQ9HJU5_9NEOP|nr:hypothetical protein PR048_016451 [Dryococelus australis]
MLAWPRHMSPRGFTSLLGVLVRWGSLHSRHLPLAFALARAVVQATRRRRPAYCREAVNKQLTREISKLTTWQLCQVEPSLLHAFHQNLTRPVASAQHASFAHSLVQLNIEGSCLAHRYSSDFLSRIAKVKRSTDPVFPKRERMAQQVRWQREGYKRCASQRQPVTSTTGASASRIFSDLSLHAGRVANTVVMWEFSRNYSISSLFSFCCTATYPGRDGVEGRALTFHQGEPGSIPSDVPNFRTLESCRAMPLVGGFSRGFPLSPALALQPYLIYSPLHRRQLLR